MKSLPASTILAAGIALGAILLLAGAAWQAGRSRNELAPHLARLDGLNTIAAEHAQLKQDLDAIKKTMGDPDKVAGPGAAGNQVTEAIYRTAKKAGLHVKSVQPVASRRSRHGDYILAGARASFNCKMEQLAKLLEELNTDDGAAGVTGLNISGDPKKPGELSVTLSVVTLARKGEASK